MHHIQLKLGSIRSNFLQKNPTKNGKKSSTKLSYLIRFDSAWLGKRLEIGGFTVCKFAIEN
jgi:hypothetical protein